MAVLKNFLRDMRASAAFAAVFLMGAGVLALFVPGAVTKGGSQALVVLAVCFIWFALSYQIMACFAKSRRVVVYRLCEGLMVVAAIVLMLALGVGPGISHLPVLGWTLVSATFSGLFHIIDPFAFRANDSERFNRRIDQIIERRRAARPSQSKEA